MNTSEIIQSIISEENSDNINFLNTKTIYKPRKIIHNSGIISDRIYYVLNGCLRTFYVKDGNEITFQFYIEGDIIILIDSFYNDKPSDLILQTIEKSVLIEFSKHELFSFFAINPQFKEHLFEKLHLDLIEISNQLLSFIKDNPAERYLQLLAKRPDLIKRIPQHYIASFLGINPVSLSRIKARLFKKK
jgi:CRP-like cAMP-binding protein